jgi:hypothetical protein
MSWGFSKYRRRRVCEERDEKPEAHGQQMAGGREAPVATKQDARDARFRVLGLWRQARSGRRARWRRGGPDEHPPAANALVNIRARGRRARGWVVAFAKGGIRRAPPGCDRRTSPPCGSDESRTPRSRSRRRSPGRKRGGKGKVGVSDARRRRSSLVVPMPERGVRARAVGRGRDPRARSDHVTASRRALERRSVRGSRARRRKRGVSERAPPPGTSP